MTNTHRLEELRARFLTEPLVITLESVKLGALKNGEAIIIFQALPKLCVKEPQVLQGGITTAILDFACVYAAMSKIPTGYTLAEHISVYLKRPVVQNETVLVIATIEDETRTSILTKGVIIGNSGKVKTVALINFRKPPEPNK